MARLLVLWLLAEQNMYGYQIKKALSDDGMAFWFALEDASIQSVLRTLEKNGHARKIAVEQTGNRPARTRYGITSDGRRHYRQLLTDALATATLPVGPIDVALAARGDLAPTVVTDALEARMKSLDELQAAIEIARPAAPVDALVERNAAIVRAERAWLDELDHETIT